MHVFANLVTYYNCCHTMNRMHIYSKHKNIQLRHYPAWENIGGKKFWQMYAYQNFCCNKLTNDLCSIFNILIISVENLIRLHFDELSTICQVCRYLTPPIFYQLH